MTEQEIEALVSRVAREAAQEAVNRAFANLGVDPTSPEHVSAWHADRLWTRNARQGSSRISMHVKTTLVGTIVTAIAFAIWNMIQAKTGGK